MVWQEWLDPGVGFGCCSDELELELELLSDEEDDDEEVLFDEEPLDDDDDDDEDEEDELLLDDDESPARRTCLRPACLSLITFPYKTFSFKQVAPWSSR